MKAKDDTKQVTRVKRDVKIAIVVLSNLRLKEALEDSSWLFGWCCVAVRAREEQEAIDCLQVCFAGQLIFLPMSNSSTYRDVSI